MHEVSLDTLQLKHLRLKSAHNVTDEELANDGYWYYYAYLIELPYRVHNIIYFAHSQWIVASFNKCNTWFRLSPIPVAQKSYSRWSLKSCMVSLIPVWQHSMRVHRQRIRQQHTVAIWTLHMN